MNTRSSHQFKCSLHARAFLLQEGGLNRASTARVFLIPHFVFKGGLVDPRMRASNEHLLSVRVPRAGGRPGCPVSPFSGPRVARAQETDQATLPAPLEFFPNFPFETPNL